VAAAHNERGGVAAITRPSVRPRGERAGSTLPRGCPRPPGPIASPSRPSRGPAPQVDRERFSIDGSVCRERVRTLKRSLNCSASNALTLGVVLVGFVAIVGVLATGSPVFASSASSAPSSFGGSSLTGRGPGPSLPPSFNPPSFNPPSSNPPPSSGGGGSNPPSSSTPTSTTPAPTTPAPTTPAPTTPAPNPLSMTLLATLTGHNENPRAVAWNTKAGSEDQIVSFSFELLSFRQWTVAADGTVTAGGSMNNKSVANARNLLTYCEQTEKFAVETNSNIEIWDATTGTADGLLDANNWVDAASWNNDCSRIVMGTYGGKVEVFDAVTRASVLEFDASTLTSASSVYAVDYSPDGSKIATGSEGGLNVQIHDAATGAVTSTLVDPATASSTSHDNGIARLAWSPDGTKIATLAQDRKLKIWDAGTGDLLDTQSVDENPQGYSDSVQWSPDGKAVAFTVEIDLFLYDVEAKIIFPPVPGQSYYAIGLSWSADSTRLALASWTSNNVYVLERVG